MLPQQSSGSSSTLDIAAIAAAALDRTEIEERVHGNT
jgi:hypothetical protein